MNNTVVELAGAPFLHTMGILGMTFIGFSAIVMLLRQTLGRRLRPFDALFAHVYMEFGLVVSVGAMLPPLFAFWNLSQLDVWRLSSALVGIPLLFLGGHGLHWIDEMSFVVGPGRFMMSALGQKQTFALQ